MYTKYEDAKFSLTFLLWRGFVPFFPFRLSKLITTLTYALIDNFCFCFWFLQISQTQPCLIFIQIAIYIFIYLDSIYPTFLLFTYQSIHPSLYLSIHPYLHLSIYLSIHISIFLFIYPFISPSPIYLSIHISISLYINSFISPSLSIKIFFNSFIHFAIVR